METSELVRRRCMQDRRITPNVAMMCAELSEEMSGASRLALAHVAARAARERPRHLARIESVLASANVQASAEHVLNAASRADALTLNFHPDRLLADGRSVARALCDEGVYRSQFETGVSNGGLTAYPDGDRDVWERTLFAGAYQQRGVKVGARPKYGGLNLMNYLNGACPRFGSCHLRLSRGASKRTTFLFGDSAGGSADLGLIGDFAPVLAPLLESAAAGEGALGRPGVSLQTFVSGLLRGDHTRRRGAFAPAVTHALNDYIEAQVHGEVNLARDVEAVAIDAAFRETETGELLLASSRRHGFEVEWHAGLQLRLAEIPLTAPEASGRPLMRWQEFCADGRAYKLAQRVADEQTSAARLDAVNIGQAAVSVVREPERWRDWGAAEQVLVHLKDLWLMLVAHGGLLDVDDGGLGGSGDDRASN